MARSNARIMGRLLGMVRPLAGWMTFAIACGTAGHLCAIWLPLTAVQDL